MTKRICAAENETGQEESIDSYRDLFLPLINQTPSLEEALDQLYDSMNIENVEIQRNKVIKECKNDLKEKFEKIQKIHPKITKDEALIICSYTYEDSKYKLSPYKILNSNLVSNTRKNGIKKVCKYFFILLKALRHLTPFNPKNKILYRSLGQKVITEIPKDNPNYIPYKVNNEKKFWAFTSTSLQPTKDFLGERDDNNSNIGTKFIIHGNIVGYDISVFSQYEEEKEILLEPERKFKIEAVCEVNEVIDVTCFMLETPLVLSDIIKVENQTEIKDVKNVENSVNNINEINRHLNNDNKIINNDDNNDQLAKISKNEIMLKIKVEQSDIENTIYFLDNTNGKYDENDLLIDHNHDNLKEINETNTTMIVNEKIVPFKKFFIPTQDKIYSIILKFKNKLTNCAYMFYDCKKIIEIDFSKFNTENVIDMQRMFVGCSSLKSLDLTSFKTDKVTNMRTMFYECSSLTSINLSSFNVENVTNMFGMFFKCTLLTSLDLSSFKTVKVQTMESMFYKCKSLKFIDLSSFKTENVTTMESMFDGCKSLTSLDLKSFNTLNVINMTNMFKLCSSLMTIDLSSFNTTNADTSYMFSKCENLSNCNSSDKNILDAFNKKHESRPGCFVW